jgi:hypothetical protein
MKGIDPLEETKDRLEETKDRLEVIPLAGLR